ncbi:MAG: hypothetical protein RIE53_06355 [Rhodothermales bacterium]
MTNPDSDAPDLIQVAWAAAQLVADSREDAVRLVERLFSEAEPTNELDVITRLERMTSGVRSRPHGIWTLSVRRDALDRTVRELLASLPAERRLAILSAWMPVNPEGEATQTERTVFTYAVRRRMADGTARQLDDTEIRDALFRVLGSSAPPVPSELRTRIDAALRTRHPGPGGPVVHPKRIHPAVRFGGALAVILIVSLIGIWVGRPTHPTDPAASAPPNLFDLLASGSEKTVLYTGPSPVQAERVLLDQFGARITVPGITDGRLEGASSMDLAGQVDVPILHYEMDGGPDLEVFVISYRLLDEFRYDFALNPASMTQLAAPDGVDITVNGNVARASWRYRDDIYTVFTTADDPAGIRSRFVYP